MKHQIVDTKVNGFKPVTVQITIETQRELEYLLALFNYNAGDMRDIVNRGIKSQDNIKQFDSPELSFYELWCDLDDINNGKF